MRVCKKVDSSVDCHADKNQRSGASVSSQVSLEKPNPPARPNKGVTKWNYTSKNRT